MQDGTIRVITDLCSQGKTNKSACVCGDAIVFIVAKIEKELGRVGHDG
jgi:hypothetical protein